MPLHCQFLWCVSLLHALAESHCTCSSKPPWWQPKFQHNWLSTNHRNVSTSTILLPSLAFFLLRPFVQLESTKPSCYWLRTTINYPEATNNKIWLLSHQGSSLPSSLTSCKARPVSFSPNWYKREVFTARMIKIIQEVAEIHPNPPQRPKIRIFHHFNIRTALYPPLWPLTKHALSPSLPIDVKERASLQE